MRFRERTSGGIIEPRVTYTYRTYCNPFKNGTIWPSSSFALATEHCYDETHPGPPYRTGGPFNHWSFSCSDPTGPEYTMRSNSKDCSKCLNYYKGTVYMPPPVTTPTGFSMWEDDSWGNAESYGAQGWNKFKPAKPGVELNQDIAELKQTWSSLMNRARSFKDIYSGRRKSPTNPAGNLLDWAYGWAPLLDDVEKAIKQYQTLDETIDRIRKQNGQWEHRGGTVNKQSEVWQSDSTGWPFVGLNLNSTFWNKLKGATNLSTFSYQCTYEYHSHAWFEGSFKYYIPNIDTPEWADKARRKLFGLNINPALLWELIPWSWLVDWISNTGDVFSNLDSGIAENLVAAYAYVMRTTTYSMTNSATVTFLTCADPVMLTTITQSSSSKITRKHRVAATPFGFGVDLGSFSPKQIAIMAALGLSRS